MKHLNSSLINHRILVLALMMMSAFSSLAHDEPVVFQAFVAREGIGRVLLILDQPWAAFRSKWQAASGEGWRLIDLEVRDDGDGRSFSGVFHDGEGAHNLLLNLGWNQLMKRKNDLSARMHLVDLEISETNGKTRFAGVWIAGARKQRLARGLDLDGLREMDTRMRGERWFLVDLEVYVRDGRRRYAGIWQENAPRTKLVLDKPWPSFHCSYHDLGTKGWRLVDLESVLNAQGNKGRFSGIWVRGRGSDSLEITTGTEASKESKTKAGARVHQMAGDFAGKTRLMVIDFEIVSEHGHVESKHPLPADCHATWRSHSQWILGNHLESPSHNGTLHSGGSGGGGGGN